jgi:hypothetical protein
MAFTSIAQRYTMARIGAQVPIRSLCSASAQPSAIDSTCCYAKHHRCTFLLSHWFGKSRHYICDNDQQQTHYTSHGTVGLNHCRVLYRGGNDVSVCTELQSSHKHKHKHTSVSSNAGNTTCSDTNNTTTGSVNIMTVVTTNLRITYWLGLYLWR